MNLFNHIVEVIYKRPIHAPQYTIPHPTFFLISTTPFSIFEVYTWLLCKLVVLVNTYHIISPTTENISYELCHLRASLQTQYKTFILLDTIPEHFFCFVPICNIVKLHCFLGCASVSAASRILSSILCHLWSPSWP